MKFLKQLAVTTALAAAAGAASAGGYQAAEAETTAAAPSATASAPTSEATMAQAKKFLERFGYSEVRTASGSKFTHLCGEGFDNATIFQAKYTNAKINVHNADMGGMVCSSSTSDKMKTYGVQDMTSIARGAATTIKSPKM